MDPIRWRDGLSDPFEDFESLKEEIDRLFDLTRFPEPRGIFERTYSPPVDVIEKPESFEVLCDLPGIDIGDVEISVAGGVLTLKGEKKQGATQGNGRTQREEAFMGRFQRTLQLPAAIEPDKVEAVLRDGVLRIVLPKQEQLKPRQIAVKAR